MLDLGIPGIKHSHFGELSHPFAIGRSRSARRLFCHGFGKTAVSGCQYQAGPKPLYIPFPWAREGFVEVIDVENQHSFG